MFGLPDGAQTVRPKLEEGRFLVPGDGNALVVTRNFLDDEPDVRIGDRVTLRTEGRDAEFTLVGIVQSPTQRPFLYAPSSAIDTLTRDAGKAGILMVITESGEAAVRARHRRPRCATRSSGAGSRSRARRPGSEIKASIDNLFGAMLLFVSVMALLLGRRRRRWASPGR